MDCMHELPAVCCNTKNDCFNSLVHSDWFFKHFVPEVRHYQENLLSIALDVVNALLHLDSAPVLPDAEKLLSADCIIRTLFPRPNTTSTIQQMDLGVIV